MLLCSFPHNLNLWRFMDIETGSVAVWWRQSAIDHNELPILNLHRKWRMYVTAHKYLKLFLVF